MRRTFLVFLSCVIGSAFVNSIVLIRYMDGQADYFDLLWNLACLIAVSWLLYDKFNEALTYGVADEKP